MMKTVAGKFWMSEFSMYVWNRKKTSTIVAVDVSPNFLPYFCVFWIPRSPRNSMSPKPRKVVPPIKGNVGNFTPTGNPKSRTFCAESTMNPVTRTWMTSMIVIRETKPSVVFHVKIVPM